MIKFTATLAADTGKHIVSTYANSEREARDIIKNAEGCPECAILKITTNPGQKTYFDLMNEAIETAISEAEKKGYTVVNNTVIFEPVHYGHTKRYTLDLLKQDKPQRKALTIVLYRMESGKYELTNYIN